MSNKHKIKELIDGYDNLISELNNHRNKMAEVWFQIADQHIDDSTKLLIKLKYDGIKYNDLESWEKIGNLPIDIIVKWEQRLWFESQNSGYGSAGKKMIENELGERGYKQLHSWLWHMTHYYLKSIQCDPSSIPRHLSYVRDYYGKANVSVKKYIERYFVMLEEEITKFEL